MEFSEIQWSVKLFFIGLLLIITYTFITDSKIKVKEPIKEPTELIEANKKKEVSQTLEEKVEDASKKYSTNLEYLNIDLDDQGPPSSDYSSVPIYLATWRRADEVLANYIPVRNPITKNDSLLNKIYKKLKSNREKYLPVLRRLYANECRRLLWRDNVEVSVGGNRNKTITFTGGVFASNANIEDSHLAAVDMLKELRFTRANYKWYEDASKYNYYTIDSEPDGK